MTSGDFFNNHRDVFEEHKIDVALIDGLHEYKGTLRDVENCLKSLSKKGIIVVHDCNPHSEISATPPNWLLRHQHVLRDAENWLKSISKKGGVVTHDCNPPSEISTTRPKWLLRLLQKLLTGESGRETWNGDVWKTIAHLRSYRDDLNIFVLDCDFGLGIITKGKPEDKLNYSAKVIKKMSYQDLDKNRGKILNLKKPEYFYEFLEKFSANEQ